MSRLTTDKLHSERWSNINWIMELVKQEGDAKCEQALDDLLAEHNYYRQDRNDFIESNLMWFNEAKKAYQKINELEQKIHKLEQGTL